MRGKLAGRNVSRRTFTGHTCSGLKRLGRVWLATVMATIHSPAAQAFGERVRARRHELGKSQEKVAQDAGLHWTFVGQVERGQRNLALSNILKLARGLEIDPGDLVRGLADGSEDAGPDTEGLPVTD